LRSFRAKAGNGGLLRAVELLRPKHPAVGSLEASVEAELRQCESQAQLNPHQTGYRGIVNGRLQARKIKRIQAENVGIRSVEIFAGKELAGYVRAPGGEIGRETPEKRSFGARAAAHPEKKID
jgi:hypothetical protein